MASFMPAELQSCTIVTNSYYLKKYIFADKNTNKLVIRTPSSDAGTSSNVIEITDDESGKLICC